MWSRVQTSYDEAYSAVVGHSPINKISVRFAHDTLHDSYNNLSPDQLEIDPISSIEETITGVVLVVDDINTTRLLHRSLLAKQFDVITASSGEEALSLCHARMPDLILLDIEMPDLDGIETCRRLRESSEVPVIFATAHDSFEVHLKAFEAGGNDIVVKPVNVNILLQKASLAIRQHREQSRLASENQMLQQMAMGFLTTMGESGNLLNYMRESVGCRNHFDLAKNLFACLSALGIQCSLMLKHGGETSFLTAHGDASPLERSVLEQAADMGRIFQFKRRLVVNYPHVSIIVADMPDESEEPERAGKIRDNVTILAETTEQLCENVDMRVESMHRAEQMQLALCGGVEAVEALRRKYHLMLVDTRLLLQEVVDKMDKAVAWLGATREEEASISTDLDSSIQTLLAMLAEGGDFENDFGKVLDALRGQTVSGDAELF